MKSIRRNVFETNSSSTHSLSISKRYYDENSIDTISNGETILLGEYGNGDFIECYKSRRFYGFKDKLYCLIAFLISYYEDRVEYWNSETLNEQFLKSCHFIWVCELLKDKYNIELDLRDFRYSGVSFEDDIFNVLGISLFYPEEFKSRIEEILSNSDIVLDYYSEEY